MRVIRPLLRWSPVAVGAGALWAMTRPRKVSGSLDAAPVPPPLAPGEVVNLPGRGETFIRDAPGPPGGPTILLLHGWMASADLNWFPCYEPLSRIGRVLAIDHRGHGRGLRSPQPFRLEDAAEDAAALLDTLQAGPAIVAGYSMGGPVAKLLWRRRPDLVAGLVLCATGGEWSERAIDRQARIWLGAATVLLRMLPSSAWWPVASPLVRKYPELEPHVPWLVAEYGRADPFALAEAGREVAVFDSSAWASEIDVPIAVVVTTRDRAVPPAKQVAIADLLPGTTVHEVPGGHGSCVTRPDEFAAAVCDAVTSVRDRIRRRSRERP